MLPSVVVVVLTVDDVSLASTVVVSDSPNTLQELTAAATRTAADVLIRGVVAKSFIDPSL